MDPFTIVWISSAGVLLLAGSIFAAREPDFETAGMYVGLSLIAGGFFPLVVVFAVIAAAIGALFLPFLAIRFFAQRQARRELKFQNLDAELDKHLDESHQLAKK